MFGLFENSKNKNIINYINCCCDRLGGSEALSIYFKYTEVQSFPLAIHYAAYNGQYSLLENLISQKGVNGKDYCGYNALHYLVYQYDVFNEYFNPSKFEDCTTVGFLDSRNLHNPMANKVQVDIKNYRISHKKKRRDEYEIIDCINLLLESGININEEIGHSVNDKGVTPLYLAIESNNLNIAKYLIEKGANASHVILRETLSGHLNFCNSPIITALESLENNFDFIKYLHSNGGVIFNNNVDYTEAIFMRLNDSYSDSPEILEYIFKNTKISTQNANKIREYQEGIKNEVSYKIFDKYLAFDKYLSV